MPRTALILGANGRFGRHVAQALQRHGWHVRPFDRSKDTLPDAAIGADLIVNAWNPPYSKWATEVPRLTASVIEAAKTSGAAVMIPGNIYVYGTDLPPILSPETPHRATHPLGKIRREMERAYREAGVKTIILRAGDFIDTEASGNWFDRVIATKIASGKITYPGPVDVPHAWAFLPNLAAAAAGLAARLDDLPVFSDLTFDGFTMTGVDLAEALGRVVGKPVRAKPMNWLPIRIARPFWAEAKHLLEMRYLWQRPHRIDGQVLRNLLPDLRATPLDDALRQACAPLIQNETSTQTSRWADAAETSSTSGPSEGQSTPAP
ncbi:epimerase [Hasllibacter sp. MH4015]|uniref:epimerase n=1 Tax=Hasllibacter sp. MH4015 TaxID=2854029 RepID=UPI001CD55B15|nr:epimerase [Hasllibacter sp. MH4015]